MMAKKLLILLLVFTLGLVLPSSGFACGKSSTKIEKTCSSKKSEAKSCKMDCCKSGITHEKNDDGCNGKCGHNSCNCSSSCHPFAIPIEQEIRNTTESQLFDKELFMYSENYKLSGFLSIWLIPKIG